jgi:hypothetical protein
MEEIKMKNLFAIASFFLAVSLSAQDGVFAPFVSRLTADVKNGLVRLSWIDSPDAKGPVTVYSSDNPINPLTVGSAPEKEPIQVPYGAQFYIDETDYTIRHYFVAASDEDGKSYYLSIPFNNILMVNMQDFLETRQDEPAPTVAAVTVDADFSLRAFIQGENIAVSFNPSGYSDLVLYRSIQPIRRMEDLSNAVVIHEDAASPLIDYTIPKISYYYAIVPQEILASGYVKIIPGNNATISPVIAPLSQYGLGRGSNAFMRSIPLPIMSIPALIGRYTVSDAPPHVLSPAAERALMDIKETEKPMVTKKPRAFKKDLEAPTNGEESALCYIMQNAFAKRDWITAREQLVRFLTLPHAADVEARARFYLGQAYYFLDMPRESLFEFLMIRREYPQEASEWINAILRILTE